MKYFPKSSSDSGCRGGKGGVESAEQAAAPKTLEPMVGRQLGARQPIVATEGE